MRGRRDGRFTRREQWERDDFGERNGYGCGRERERVSGNIGSIKMKIPPFYGKNDLDAYLEWERQMELILERIHYSEEKKMKLAAVEFKEYAIVW